MKRRYRKLMRALNAALPFFALAALVLAAAFFPQEHEEEEKARAVVVWNVDTFEGGKGSRTAFLKQAAKRVEEGRTGVYYLITSVTLEGALDAFSEGNFPDALSFGVGLFGIEERAIPLPYAFAGGAAGGNTLAYPWCRGEYFLFSLDEDFKEAGKTVISCGGNNLSSVAAALAGISGERAESTAAYVAFLNGKYRTLLGTQRDVCRFEARGVAVHKEPLSEYCDLIQYFSVLNAEKREDALALLQELLSEETRDRLGEIGMYPPEGIESTVNIFSEEAYRGLKAEAEGGAERKSLRKFLKTVEKKNET